MEKLRVGQIVGQPRYTVTKSNSFHVTMTVFTSYSRKKPGVKAFIEFELDCDVRDKIESRIEPDLNACHIAVL